MHPDLQPAFDRLENQRTTLFQYLQTLTEAQVHTPPPGGGWSVVQVVNHLRLVEGFTYQYLLKKLEFQTDIPPVSLVTRFRMWLLLAILVSPIKFKAPKGTFNQSGLKLSDELAAWEAGRLAFRQTLDQLPEQYLHLGIMKHIRAGKVSIAQMLLFYRIHARRHIGQIQRTVDAFT